MYITKLILIIHFYFIQIPTLFLPTIFLFLQIHTLRTNTIDQINEISLPVEFKIFQIQLTHLHEANWNLIYSVTLCNNWQEACDQQPLVASAQVFVSRSETQSLSAPLI